MAARVASTAAQAAIELAQKKSMGRSVFDIKASSFDFVLPQAASSPQHLSLHAGDLSIRYLTFPRPGEGSAILSLEEVTICSHTGCQRGDDDEDIVNTPIRVSINVDIPPLDAPTEDERAMRVKVYISRAMFFITSYQYASIMKMLAFNIGEINPFLRNESIHLSSELSHEYGNESIQMNRDDTGKKKEVCANIICNEKPSIGLTHGGVEAVIVVKRIYMNFKFDEVVVELCGESTFDPIVSVAALKTSIILKLFPDLDQMQANATLHDLVCEDRRLISINRPFRQIICQRIIDSLKAQASDVFELNYVKANMDTSQDLELIIGRPQVVLIPDVIADIIEFFSLDGNKPSRRKLPKQEALSTLEDIVDIDVEHNEEGEEKIETSFGQHIPGQTKTTTISLKTADCSLLLIDMGIPPVEDLTISAKRTIQMTEAVILQGMTEANLKLVSNSSTQSNISTNLELHAERVEIYTAEGSALKCPKQILEPSKFSFFVKTLMSKTGEEFIDINFVTLSNMNVGFSMQNAALLRTIYSSMDDSLSHRNRAIAEDDNYFGVLSDNEVAQIENVASALEEAEDSEIESSSESEPNENIGDVQSISDRSKFDEIIVRKVSLKMTLPELSLIVINDLQGLDEALFKVRVCSLVLSSDCSFGEAEGPIFQAQMNASILGDYFDSQTNFWEPFFVRPWEINFKAIRGSSKRYKSARKATSFDIESFPCAISFSEQFLIGIGAASSMWSIYNGATNKAIALGMEAMNIIDSKETPSTQIKRVSVMKSMASSAARSLVTSLPYAIENRSGIMIKFHIGQIASDEEDATLCTCPPSTTQYFRFQLAKVEGTGGWRAYGQDLRQYKSLYICIGEYKILLKHVDDEVNRLKCAHSLGNGQYVFTDVVKRGKATIIEVSSYMDIYNETSIDFRIDIKTNQNVQNVGISKRKKMKELRKRMQSRMSSKYSNSDTLGKSSKALGIPTHLLPNKYSENLNGKNSVSLVLSSLHSENVMSGVIRLPSFESICQMAKDKSKINIFEVSCSTLTAESIGQTKTKNHVPDKIIVQVCCQITLVGNTFPCIQYFLQPRLLLTNLIPLGISVRTPMPHSISNTSSYDETLQETTHNLHTHDTIEVYTPGPSTFFSMKCTDSPISGTLTGWSNGGLIDIPLGFNETLQERLECLFPFVDSAGRTLTNGGSAFSLSEMASFDGQNHKITNTGQTMPQDKKRNVIMTIPNLGVDHTGEILFDFVYQNEERKHSLTKRRGSQVIRQNIPVLQKLSQPFSAFSSKCHKRRLSLLPYSTSLIRLLKFTIDGNNGLKKSIPFRVSDISLCEGGIESSQILWEDQSESGYYAYRRLSSNNQSEIHVIPEYVLFNGSDDTIKILQSNGKEFELNPDKMAPLYKLQNHEALFLQLEFISNDGLTTPIRVDNLGMNLLIVKSKGSELPIGSVAVQTVIGQTDSRFVIKVGKLKQGNIEGEKLGGHSTSLFENDFLRFRIRWSEMEITLYDTKDVMAKRFGYMNSPNNLSIPQKRSHISSSGEISKSDLSYSKVAKILFHRFTVDFQRIFKDAPVKSIGENIDSHDRSQLSIIVHNIRVSDCTSGTDKIVLECFSQNSNVFDFCIRTRNSGNSALVNVDLIDLNLAFSGRQSDPIIIRTSESFIWNILDILSRTNEAKNEIAGVDIELEWDQDQEEFTVNISDISNEEKETFDEEGKYHPPRSDKMYKIAKARVSPSMFMLSFKRQPQASRYQAVRKVRGAKFINYFTTKLKFTIEKAEIKLPGYTMRNVKGPPDRIFEMIKAFYSSNLKRKLFHLLAATSIDDWKSFAGREDGDETYLEGDILRLTGNLAGRSAGFILKKVGQGIGYGVVAGTAGLGNSIQQVTEVLGVGVVGAGVNSVVSGLGEGVGDTVQGVGAGTGKIIRGAGKGVGMLVGGVGGGLELAAKGIGKSVVTGDANALFEGIGDGAVAVGSGVINGVESIGTGVGEGVLSVGKGIFSGAKSVGKGVGGIFGYNRNSSKNEKKK